MNKIKLSICIGTYNRSEYICETLDSILTQNLDCVEIIIVDGASTDDTHLLLKKYQNNYKNLHYYRLPSKGGFDKDYSIAVNYANGEYCWLFGDDDIVKLGSIDYILEQLKYKYDSIIVNAEIKNTDMSQLLKNKCINLSHNKIYEKKDFQEFFTDTAAHSSFVGSIIIKRSIWNIRNKKIYFGTLLVHVGVLFQSNFQGKLLTIAKPLVSIRYGNALWTVKSFEISLFIWPKLIWEFTSFPDSAKKIITPREPWRNIVRLLYFRARGSYSSNEYNKYLSKEFGFFKNLLAYYIARIPGKFLNIIFYSYFFIFQYFHRNAKSILIDLEKSIYYFGPSHAKT